MPCLVCTPDEVAVFSERAGILRDQVVERGFALRPSGEIVGTILILHGRRGRKENYLPVAERFCAVGFRCVIPDLPGHGEHTDKYATYGVKEGEMVLDCYRECAEEFGFSGQPCAVFGQSMGGSVAIHTCALEGAPFGAMVVLASFDKLENVIRHQTSGLMGPVLGTAIRIPADYAVGWMSGVKVSEIRPVDLGAGISIPTLVAHGDADRKVPVSTGRALYDALPEDSGKRWLSVPGADHNDVDGREAYCAILAGADLGGPLDVEIHHHIAAFREVFDHGGTECAVEVFVDFRTFDKFTGVAFLQEFLTESRMDWMTELTDLGLITLAALLAGLVGLEREDDGKPAGFRTHMIIGGAAALLVVCGKWLVNSGIFERSGTAMNYDPIRIMEAVIVGVSFIGAGTILKMPENEKGKFEEFAANPEKAAAELIVATNPDLEKISENVEQGEMTIRTKDGKEMTVSYKDISEGKIVMTDQDGNETLIGSSDLSKVPEWVPVAPDFTDGVSTYQSTSGGKVSGQFSGTTGMGVEQLKAFYSEKATALGMTSTSNNSMNSGDTAVATLRFSGGGKSIAVVITQKPGAETRKLKELGLDGNDSPEKITAELVISMNPEYEKVSSNDETGEMTVRDKSGNEMTLKYSDIAESRFDRAEGDVPGAVPTE
eukprot:g3479.t1